MDYYAASEGVPFIQQCPQGKYHVRWQSGIFEIRNDGGVARAGTGELVCTSFVQDRTPLIRYSTGDLVEEKAALMRKLGKKQLIIQLQQKLDAVPAVTARERLVLADGGSELVYTYDTQAERTGITTLLQELNAAGIRLRDLSTHQSSLEEIFVGLVHSGREGGGK